MLVCGCVHAGPYEEMEFMMRTEGQESHRLLKFYEQAVPGPEVVRTLKEQKEYPQLWQSYGAIIFKRRVGMQAEPQVWNDLRGMVIIWALQAVTDTYFLKYFNVKHKITVLL